LLGVWTYGQEAMLGKEVLKHHDASGQPSPDGSSGEARCPPEVIRP